MYIQNNSWKRMYRDCAKTVSQIRPKESIRCNSSLCAVKDSMLSLDKYFGKETGSLAEVRFLVENVYVMITGILELNNSLFEVDLTEIEKAIEKSFTDKDVIRKFRALRDSVSEHPEVYVLRAISLKDEIVPVINVVLDSMEQLTQKAKQMLEPGEAE